MIKLSAEKQKMKVFIHADKCVFKVIYVCFKAQNVELVAAF